MTVQPYHKDSAFIGIDIGGTFTDAVLFSNNGLKVMKILTNSENPAKGVLELIEKMGALNFSLTHGSTLATNAVLERKGEKTAFLASEGFAHTLLIGRQDRKELYNFDMDIPQPLVPIDLCYGVPERIDFQGDISKHINRDAVREVLEELTKKGVKSVSVCLLFSYKNPDHERDIKVLAQNLPLPLFVSISSEVLPQFREYERASTTTINAYVSPILNRYIADLEENLKNMDCRSFKIMQSNGGMLPVDEISSLGVKTVLSGPAGGVAGAFYTAKAAGYPHIIALDMGGTSTDISLCEGEIKETGQGEIGGFPIGLPMVDIITIGAGGGSIAKVDAGGVLKTGPESAGSKPGPAAYGKGTQPTVTDAHLVLGTLHPDDFLGGDFTVDKDKAIESVKTLADKMGLTVEETALGIVKIAISHMEKAMRVVSIEKGRDPAQFTLIPFGGAGPIHALSLAENLDIKGILIPRNPGVLSALGMLLSDFRIDFSQTVLLPSQRIDHQVYQSFMGALYKKAGHYLNKGYFEKGELEHIFDLRYKGQSFEIGVKGEKTALISKTGHLYLPPINPIDVFDLMAKFHKEHERVFGYSRKDEPVEFVNFRLKLTGYSQKPQFIEKPEADQDCSEAYLTQRLIIDENGSKREIPVYSREKLKPGNRLPVPSIVRQYDTTVIIREPWHAYVDRYENIILER